MTKIDQDVIIRHREMRNLVSYLTQKEKPHAHRLLSVRCVYTDSCITPISMFLKNDSLNLVGKLIEIIPIEYSKSRRVVHNYKRIKVEELTAERIPALYHNKNFKSSPTVLDLGSHFLIYYDPKPPIFLNKSNGRIYTLDNSKHLEEAQHQASILMAVLATFELVEGHNRRTIIRRTKYESNRRM